MADTVGISIIEAALRKVPDPIPVTFAVPAATGRRRGEHPPTATPT